MNRGVVSAALVVLGAVSSGCISTHQHFRDKGLQRASFDLSCPAEQMSISVLSGEQDQIATVGDQVGVSGCGKKAAYVLVQGNWILNSSNSRAE